MVLQINQAWNIKNLKNLKYIYWVLLSEVLKLINSVYTKKKPVFHEFRALLDIIAVQ